MNRHEQQMAGIREQQLENLVEQVVFLHKHEGNRDEQFLKMHKTLAACAYWAASGLRAWSDSIDAFSRQAMLHIMLENILKESKEYAESEPGRDSNIMFHGREYSYTPVGGFPEPVKEPMNADS